MADEGAGKPRRRSSRCRPAERRRDDRGPPAAYRSPRRAFSPQPSTPGGLGSIGQGGCGEGLRRFLLSPGKATEDSREFLGQLNNLQEKHRGVDSWPGSHARLYAYETRRRSLRSTWNPIPDVRRQAPHRMTARGAALASPHPGSGIILSRRGAALARLRGVADAALANIGEVARGGREVLVVMEDHQVVLGCGGADHQVHG
jgi:hypothetical protein